MPLVVNTNIASMNAQRNLDKSAGMLGKALERLSSGLRVNSAADDAAGLAISDRMFSQIKGTNQGIRNANDGISLSQTAEGALQEYTNAIQRMRELAVQSANATNSSTDRAALNNEYGQLLAEMDRIATQTTFNGNQVLNGTLGTLTFQVGANVGDTIALGLSTSVRTNAVGQIAESTSPDATGVDANAILAATVSINGTNIAASVAGSGAGQTADSAWSKNEAIKASGIANVTSTAVAATVTTTAFAAAANVVHNVDAATKTYTLTINGVTIYSATNLATGTGLTAANVAAQVNLFSGQTGVAGSVNATSHLVLTAADGRNIVVTQDSNDADVTTSILTAGGAAIAANGAAAEDFTNRGKIKLSSNANITLGGTVARIGFTGVTSIALDTTTVSATDLLSVANAETAIKRLDATLTSVGTLRATLGAIQNRMTSTIANLATVVQNVSDARGRILDADFAVETANLTKSQILREAGSTILAQANSIPQQVLALLRG
jgi:flagellin